MADLYSTRATSALNEKDYINKLYDTSLGAQKDTIQQGYDQSIQQLNSSQQATKQQTSDYLKRAYVEGQRASGHVEKPNIIQGTAGADAQARLTMGNRNQANRSTLASAQSAADAEYQRQRQLKADWYSSQIKQAQADNDMNRAQALYDAAKAEEEQLHLCSLSVQRPLQRAVSGTALHRNSVRCGFYAHPGSGICNSGRLHSGFFCPEICK